MVLFVCGHDDDHIFTVTKKEKAGEGSRPLWSVCGAPLGGC